MNMHIFNVTYYFCTVKCLEHPIIFKKLFSSILVDLAAINLNI